jgi:hypothetical protein
MPFDPDSPDPSELARIRALPHIVVHPKPPPNSPPADGIDDWYVPGNPRTYAPLPDDWYVPYAAPNANAGLSNPPAAPSANGPAAPPIPFANLRSAAPNPFANAPAPFSAAQLGAMAWHPPIFPGDGSAFHPSIFSTAAWPQQSSPPAAPAAAPDPTTAPGWLAQFASPAAPWSSDIPSAMFSRDPSLPAGGLFGSDPDPTSPFAGPPGRSNPPAAPVANWPVAPPIPFADDWSLIPASRAGAEGGLLGQLATLGAPPPITPPWPQGGVLGGLPRLAPSSPGPSGSSPPPPQSAGAQAASPIGRRPIGDYSSGEIAGDAAKSLGVGTGQGVIHLAGLSGDVREMLSNGAQRTVDYFAPGDAPNVGSTASKALASTFRTLAGPTSSQLQNAVESFTGPFYQPKTIVGDYARTAGEFLPASLLVPGGGLASNALRYGLLPALSSETAGQLTKGTAAEPWARTLAAILAAAAPSALRQLQSTRGAPGVSETPPTSSEAGGPTATSEQSGPTAQLPLSDLGPDGASSGRGVWDRPPVIRGRLLEDIFGRNLHPNHPTIDIWDPNTGAVTSLKSVDLEAPSYQVEDDCDRALYNRLSNNINDLAEFNGGHYANTYVPEHGITSRTLTVIVPSLGTAGQGQVLRQIIEVAKQRGVIVRVGVYR